MDGGIVYNTNLVSGIHKCREHVDSDEKIVVDVILCSYFEEYVIGEAPKTTLENVQRYREISNHYRELDDIIKFMHAFEDVQFRYIFTASEPLVTGLDVFLFT
mmetsp:Transcript_38431/g.36788  ORF Transcript_38431/g.36788 Transcript_38431/m.36788 type:complete len:103 (-) Transcript_38431:208-516(-)